MTFTKIASITLFAFAATTAQAQNVSTSNGDVVMIEKHQAASVPTPAVAGSPATAAAPVTGFTPLAGAALGAAGPLALGLGANIAIGAIASGSGSQ